MNGATRVDVCPRKGRPVNGCPREGRPVNGCRRKMAGKGRPVNGCPREGRRVDVCPRKMVGWGEDGEPCRFGRRGQGSQLPSNWDRSLLCSLPKRRLTTFGV